MTDETTDKDGCTVREYPSEAPEYVVADMAPTTSPETPSGELDHECNGAKPFRGTECDEKPIVWAGVDGFCREHFFEAGYSLEDYGVESIEELPDRWTE